MFFILKALGIVLLCILLIILVALISPVKILAYTDTDKKLKILYKWLFFTFGKKPNPNAPILRFAKRTTGISTFENFENIGDNIERHGFSNTIDAFFSLVSKLLSEVKFLLPHCTIKKFVLKVIHATENCALTGMTYGAICSVIYPVLNYIFTVTKQKDNCTNVKIACDFNTSVPEFSFDITLSLTAYFVLVAYLRLAIQHYRAGKTQSR